ncbi:hypothetical protein Glove_318g67 [Diversispora epigaea]|uniref:Uncharacterized protein n=1 Tax=Diversispora epigaea TaxID=1348612 RepID=A0A397HQ51_9GLOM|nr:hypothetical protein Glove_318g67 [Diversispora epigaea]
MIRDDKGPIEGSIDIDRGVNITFTSNTIMRVEDGGRRGNKRRKHTSGQNSQVLDCPLFDVITPKSCREKGVSIELNQSLREMNIGNRSKKKIHKIYKNTEKEIILMNKVNIE